MISVIAGNTSSGHAATATGVCKAEAKAEAQYLCRHVHSKLRVPLQQLESLQVVLGLLEVLDGVLQQLLSLCRVCCSQLLRACLTVLSSSDEVTGTQACCCSILVVTELLEQPETKTVICPGHLGMHEWSYQSHGNSLVTIL